MEKMDNQDTKSELWTKYYEEEKSRLERELLQAVFGNKAPAASAKETVHQPVSSGSKTAAIISERSHPGAALYLDQSEAMFISPAPKNHKRSEHSVSFAVDESPEQPPTYVHNSPVLHTSSAISPYAKANASGFPPMQNRNDNQDSVIDKLQNIRTDLVKKWAQEYVSSNSTNINIFSGKTQQLLEALMKIRGAVQNEHENLLRSQRETLVKQADTELQTQVLQEKVNLERQYRDYVLAKLAQYIYQAQQLPVEITVQKTLEDIQQNGLLTTNVPSTLDAYLQQRSHHVYEDCKNLIDKYVQRKLATAGSVLVQQHRENIGTLQQPDAKSSDINIQASLNSRIQEVLQSEKIWIQDRYHSGAQNQSSVHNSQSASFRTVEHELWQKSYLAFQKNVTLAGQIALLKQL